MEEFRVIISTMKEFKEYQENLPRRGRARGTACRRVFAPRAAEHSQAGHGGDAGPDGWVEEKMTKEEEEMTEQRARLTIPKGILFEVPPDGEDVARQGCPGEAGVPFFTPTALSLSMFVGAPPSACATCSSAREVSPSIIFIDESTPSAGPGRCTATATPPRWNERQG